MNVLLSLPTDVIHTILLEWLLLNEFCALDSAVCNVSLRHSLLDAIDPRFPNVIFHLSKIEQQYCESSNTVKYICARNVPVDTLLLTNLICLTNLGCWSGLKVLQELTFRGCTNQSAMVLFQFSNTCCSLRKLILTNSAFMTSGIVQSFITKNPRTLTSLSLCSCLNLRDEVVLHIALYCSNLKELYLDNCTKLSDEGLLVLTTSKEYHSLSLSLNVLHLNDNRQLECDTLQKIFLWCKSLGDIAVANCYGIDDAFVDSICKKHGSSLQALNVSSTDITDASLVSISRYCNNMRTLDISYCNDFTDQGILMLAHSCPCLESFNCHSCDLNSEALGVMVQQCTRLTVFNASSNYIENSTVELIAANLKLTVLHATVDEDIESGLLLLSQRCSTLTSIDFSYCIDLTDEAICPVLAANTRLTSFNFCRCDVSSVTLQALAEHCPLLRELNINRVKQVDDSGVLALAGRCPLLKIVAFENIPLTDESLVPFFNTHRGLTHVDISGMSEVTDASVIALSGSKGLLKCSLSCTKVTNTGLAALRDHSQGLLELDISNCPLITDEGICLLYEDGGFPLLDVLYCFVLDRFGSQRTPGAIDRLIDARPDLVVINEGGEFYDEDNMEGVGVTNLDEVDMLDDDDVDDGFDDFDGEDESIQDEDFDSMNETEEEQEEEEMEEDLRAALVGGRRGGDEDLVIVASDSSDELEDDE